LTGAAPCPFAGFRFKALPAPAGKQGWEVLSLPRDATRADVDAAWRRLSSQHHPNQAGAHDKMSELNQARDEALKET